jgi:hypothetical protein
MKIIFTTFAIMNLVGAFVVSFSRNNFDLVRPNLVNKKPYRKIHFDSTNSMVDEQNDVDSILTNRILEHAVKKKIFTEVANDSDLLQTFDNFNPLYIVVLIVSSIYSSDIKYNNKIEKLQKINPKPIYRILDFTMLVIVITLMKNVKNAI